MGKINSSWYSSNSDEWATPQVVFDELNREFDFDLDPCATSSNAKCSNYYTMLEDGLQQDWSGHRVFCNPPFSRMKDWVAKCSYESQKPNTLVVMLIPARTDTRYFHDYIYNKAELRFIKGRLHYNDGPQGAPFPSMVVIF